MFAPRGYWHRRHPLQQSSNRPLASPRVVSIPVHFFPAGDEERVKQRRKDPELAAVKIQKAVRGFLVRRNVKAVRDIDAEVGRIAKRMEESREVLRRDERERLGVNEMLMRALFRLDSVRGVRDCRKKVVRRVISLQEALDCIAASCVSECCVTDIDEAVVEEQPHDSFQTPFLDAKSNDSGQSCVLDEAAADQEDGPLERTSESADVGRVSGDQQEGPVAGTLIKMHDSEEGEYEVDAGEESKGRKEAMRRMVQESERLQGLVVQLLEKNAMQCRMISGLSQRVEGLERKVDRLGRRKRRKGIVKTDEAKECARKF